MAQVGFILSDEGRTITGVNDSTTTAITAGDPVYFTTNNDVLTGTAATARAAYAYGDIKVKAVKWSNTGYKTPGGIALTDGPADKQLTISMEGVFLTPVNSDTEAGDALVFDASTSSKVDKLVTVMGAIAGSTAGTIAAQYKSGRALTGGTADGKYVIWKLSL